MIMSEMRASRLRNRMTITGIFYSRDSNCRRPSFPATSDRYKHDELLQRRGTGFANNLTRQRAQLLWRHPLLWKLFSKCGPVKTWTRVEPIGPFRAFNQSL